MESLRYPPLPGTIWHTFVFGNVPGLQLDWIWRPAAGPDSPSPLHAQHLRFLVQLFDVPDPSASTLTLGNLSFGDTRHRPGRGALGLLTHFRLPRSHDHSGRPNPPLVVALVAVDRELDQPTVLAAARELLRLTEGGQPAGERPIDEVYARYVEAAARSPEAAAEVWRAFMARFEGLPTPGPGRPGRAWVVPEDAVMPSQVEVLADAAPSRVQETMAGLAAVLFHSRAKWSAITTARPVQTIPDQGTLLRFASGAEALSRRLSRLSADPERLVTELLPVREDEDLVGEARTLPPAPEDPGAPPDPDEPVAVTTLVPELEAATRVEPGTPEMETPPLSPTELLQTPPPPLAPPPPLVPPPEPPPAPVVPLPSAREPWSPPLTVTLPGPPEPAAPPADRAPEPDGRFPRKTVLLALVLVVFLMVAGALLALLFGLGDGPLLPEAPAPTSQRPPEAPVTPVAPPSAPPSAAESPPSAAPASPPSAPLTEASPPPTAPALSARATPRPTPADRPVSKAPVAAPSPDAVATVRVRTEVPCRLEPASGAARLALKDGLSVPPGTYTLSCRLDPAADYTQIHALDLSAGATYQLRCAGSSCRLLPAS